MSCTKFSLINLMSLFLLSVFLSKCANCGSTRKVGKSQQISTNSDDCEEPNTNTDGKIFFPGEMQVQVSSRSKRKCTANFCDDLDRYPDDYINNLLNRNGKFNEFFHNDVSPPVEIADRAHFDYSTENTLCESVIEARYPKTGINTNNTQRIIVNTEGLKQLVLMEVCNPNAKCKFSDSFPNDYEASCKQKYMRRRLVSMDENSNEPFVDIYDIPCCCVCSIKRI